MTDLDKINLKTSPVGNSKKQIQSDTRLSKVLFSQDTEKQKVIAARSMNPNSDRAKAEPNPSKKVQRKRGEKDKKIQGAAGMSKGLVHDQIIIAPEIMCKILEDLDLRSLKNCRLVCKSWLQQTQTHMDKKAVVRFLRNFGSAKRICAFKDVLKKKVKGTLPQPFRYLDVDLDNWERQRGSPLPYKLQLTRLQNILSYPQLTLTRFAPANIPLQLVLPLIIKCSASLEYLRLEAQKSGKNDPDYLPPMDPKQTFPSLRHVNADVAVDTHEVEAHKSHFSSIVAWIVNSSPQLEIWQSRTKSNKEFPKQLLSKVNIKNVKTLILSDDNDFNREAYEHLLSIPFSRLEHLRLSNTLSDSWFSSSDRISFAAVAIAKNCVNTLKKLDLSVMNMPANSEFPVCYNVEELTLSVWDNRTYLFSNCFPALRVLNAQKVDVNLLGEFWSDLTPFLGVKTLRAKIHGDNTDSCDLSMKFLEKFPELERVRLDAKTLLGCCRLKGSGDSRYSNIFEGVKHLEMLIEDAVQLDPLLLRVLQRIETITVPSLYGDFTWIPFRDMPSVRVLQFQWNDFLKLDKLLEIARGVEKVVVTNCCSVPRVQTNKSNSKEILSKFFESAPNAEYGCSENKQIFEHFTTAISQQNNY